MFVWVCMLQVHTVGFVVIIHPNTRTHDVVTSQWGCGGALRVSSSRIAKVYFELVIVFHGRFLLFLVVFLLFMVLVYGFLCLTKYTYSSDKNTSYL